MPLAVHWPTDYEGVANSFGYAVHNSKAREAIAAAGVAVIDSAPVALHVSPPHRFEPIPGKKNILYCAWEASELPELFRTAAAGADAICVTASFLAAPFSRMFPDKRIFVVPLGVDSEAFRYVDRTRAPLRPDFHKRPFRFLWNGAPNARKGGLHVLEAWQVFEDSKRFELYFKTSMPADSKSRQGVVRKGNVIYDDRRLSLDELVGVYHRAHSFVFPSVGEGFGLTFAEAVSTGLPAIYTAATSLVDIVPPESDLGYPVKFEWSEQDWSWKDADARGTPMTVKVNVASADTTDLAEQMICVSKEPLEAFERGRRAAEFVQSRFTWKRCGESLAAIVRLVSGITEDSSCQDETVAAA